jgi:hypothetical protein
MDGRRRLDLGPDRGGIGIVLGGRWRSSTEYLSLLAEG